MVHKTPKKGILKRPKVLLIYPSTPYGIYWGGVTGVQSHLLEIASFLKYNKIEAEILDIDEIMESCLVLRNHKLAVNIQKFKKEATRLISERDFDIAGISCWSSLNYLSTIMVAEICRKIKGESIIVVGGYHPSALPSDFIYPKSPFDFIVRGEGEIALLNIVKDGKKSNKGPTLIEGTPLNLEKSFPLDWQNYKCLKKAVLGVYLSRDCPFSCTFCMESAKTHHGWRGYSVAQAVERLKCLIDIKHPKRIWIWDACFAFNKAWRQQFLSELIRNKALRDTGFWAEIRIDLLDKKDIDLFAKLDFQVDFGLESCSEEMLHIMKKTYRPRQYLRKVKEVFPYVYKKEIPTCSNMIFNHPGETHATYLATIKFLRSLLEKQKKISGVWWPAGFAFFPGSHVHKHLEHYEEKYGTVVKHKEWWKERGDQCYLARCIIPSRDRYLRDKVIKEDFEQWWSKGMQDLNRLCAKKMSPKMRKFWKKYPFGKRLFYKLDTVRN